MKKIIIAIMACLPLMGMAQNSWETENEQGQQVNPEQKYLAGAVPVVNGKVQFTLTALNGDLMLPDTDEEGNPTEKSTLFHYQTPEILVGIGNL